MLATIGFITTGLFFWIFAYTFYSRVVLPARLNLINFSFAYYCLGMALVTWGIASYLVDPGILAKAVIIGDIFLLIGTLFMVSLLGKTYLTLLAFVAAVAFVVLRLKIYFPEPFMKSGILIFNAQAPVAVGLGCIIALVWLPINMRVSGMVAAAAGLPSARSFFNLIYSLATMAAVVFIAARRPLIAVLSFAALSVCFVMLIASNALIGNIREGQKDAA